MRPRRSKFERQTARRDARSRRAYHCRDSWRSSLGSGGRPHRHRSRYSGGSSSRDIRGAEECAAETSSPRFCREGARFVFSHEGHACS
jgi:hypothetical protein